MATRHLSREDLTWLALSPWGSAPCLGRTLLVVIGDVSIHAHRRLIAVPVPELLDA